MYNTKCLYTLTLYNTKRLYTIHHTQYTIQTTNRNTRQAKLSHLTSRTCQYLVTSKAQLVIKAQFSTTEVLAATPMTRLLFRIVPCLAGGIASAKRLTMLVMRPADGLWSPLLSLLLHFEVQYKFLVFIIIFVFITQIDYLKKHTRDGFSNYYTSGLLTKQ